MDWKKLLSQNPTNKDLFMFFLQLSSFENAGINVSTALEKIKPETRQMRLRQAIGKMQSAINTEGLRLSEAMLREKFFPNFIVHSIKAGEESGTLDKILKEVGFFLKQEGEIERKIKSALLPIKFIVVLLVVAVSIIFFFVIPKFKKIFAELNAKLPMISKVIFGTIDVLANYWYFFALLFAALIVGYIYIYKTQKYKIDAFYFKVPIYKDLLHLRLQYQIATILQLFFQAGLGTTLALKHLVNVSDNHAVRRAIARISDLISNHGLNLHESFYKVHQESKLFDFMLLNFIGTGEESGSIPELLLEAKNYYKDVLLSFLEDFGNKVSMIFLIPTTLVILSLLLSIYVPMLSLLGQMNK